MSIAAGTQKALRSFRSLITFTRAACFFIKDLKDLENSTTRAAIDIKDLKDLRPHLDDGARGGQAPALREKNMPLTVGRGPVPRHATIAGDRPPRYGKKQ